MQNGYDSPYSESMPAVSSEFSTPAESDTSSCIQDEDEGTAQKPNVFKNLRRNSKNTVLLGW